MMETEKLRTINKHMINVFRNDHIGERIRRKGLYEKQSLRYVRGLFKGQQNMVVFDVGANIGNHSLDFSTYAAQVFSFEPVGITFDVLNKNIIENHISNVTPINCALSDEAGESIIYLYPHNIGASGFAEKVGNSPAVKVKKIIGDGFFEEKGLQRLDLLKIDVEGHEPNVLRGLMKTIKQYKPVIMMEWNEEKTREEFNRSGLLDELKTIYKISVLGDNKDRQYWQGRPMANFRRMLVRRYFLRLTRIYAFDENKLYKNIILTPKEK